MITDKTCKMCGAVFSGGPRAAYCNKCKILRRRELATTRRAKAVKRQLGSTDYCEICGSPYVVKGANARYCPDCAEKVKRENHHKPAQRHRGDTDVCERCGKEYIIESGTQKYCRECAHSLNLERSRAKSERSAEVPIGSVVKCAVCGGDFIKTGGKQFYCPNCAEEAVKAIDRKQSLDWYRANRDMINLKRKAARRKKGESK